MLGLLGLQMSNNDYYLDDPGEQFSGGETTTFDITQNAFDLEAANISDVMRSIDFQDGNANFNRVWIPGGNSTVDGLGPTMNSNSCTGCHVRDGRGRPPEDGTNLTSMLLRISKKNEKDSITGSVVGMDHFGNQLNTLGIEEHASPHKKIPHEGKAVINYEEIQGSFPDGESYTLRKPSYSITWNVDGTGGTDNTKIHVEVPNPNSYDISPRTAPMIPGLGLLEAIPESTLNQFSDPDDHNGDGVSGRMNKVWDVSKKQKVTGRFGWKANQPNLNQQNAGALIGDLGLTSSLFPDENCPPAQTLCSASPSGRNNPEIRDSRLERITFYTSLVSVPGRRGWNIPEVREGKKLFIEIGCSSCHIPRMKTGDHSIQEISNQEIRPYTDLLLHDMGDGLADNRPDFEANGKEWRTPPLWGIGLVETVNGHNLFLHDGRARGFQEAILWHGGEAETVKSRYMNLEKKDREKLLKFLSSL